MNTQAYTINQAQQSKVERRQSDHRVVPLSYRLAGAAFNVASWFSVNWASERLCDIWFTVFKSKPKPWVDEFWRQADQRVEIALGDINIAIHTWGEGPLIVMMHGWSGSGTQFRRFIPALVKAGYRVAVFDAPAHGQNPGKFAHLAHFTETLVAIQHQMGPINTVVAHSLGAMASTLATHRGLRVSRLVMLAPALGILE